MKIQTLAIAVLSMLIAACSGGTTAGLLPAPKVLAGDVDGDFYTAENGAFRVRLPHPPSRSPDDANEWRYSEVREIAEVDPTGEKTIVGVVFGPAAMDRNLYHAVLIPESLESPATDHAKNIFASKAKARGGDLSQEHFEVFDLNGRAVYYAVYRSEAQYLLLSLTDNGSSFYAVEADIVIRSNRAPKSIDVLISREWETFNAMLGSFTVLNDQS